LITFGGAQPDERDSTGEQTDWLTLGEASRMLGVAPETLRRWSDRGRVASFTTVGGHRRFSRRTMLQLLPAARERRPSLAQLGTSPEKMARAYRQAHAGDAPPLSGWISGLDSNELATFRSLGVSIAHTLLAHLDAEEPELALTRLQEACSLAGDYGRHCSRLELPLADAVAAFLKFRGPFIDELARTARQRGLDTREATQLLVEAQNACDRLLLSFIEALQPR
jgi:excisionase family DNA binding protein